MNSYKTVIPVDDVTIGDLDGIITALQEHGSAVFNLDQKAIHASFEVGGVGSAAEDLWDLRDVIEDIQATYTVKIPKPQLIGARARV